MGTAGQFPASGQNGPLPSHLRHQIYWEGWPMEGVASGGVVLGGCGFWRVWLLEGVAREGATLGRLSGSQSPIPRVV